MRRLRYRFPQRSGTQFLRKQRLERRNTLSKSRGTAETSPALMRRALAVIPAIRMRRLQE